MTNEVTLWAVLFQHGIYLLSSLSRKLCLRTMWLKPVSPQPEVFPCSQGFYQSAAKLVTRCKHIM